MGISDVMYVGLMVYQGFVLFLVKVICKWPFCFYGEGKRETSRHVIRNIHARVLYLYRRVQKGL